MTYARQRQDLLKQDLNIPIYNDLEAWQAGTVSEYVQLDQWVKVNHSDDVGRVYTEAGLIDSIDLDFMAGDQTRKDIK